MEKAITYYPALIKLLESFEHVTRASWSHSEFTRDLRFISDYRSKDTQAIVQKVRAEVDDVTLKVLIHHIALIHWASSTLLATNVDDERRDFKIHGDMRGGSAVDLSPAEKALLLEIYRSCRSIPFIDDLRSRNFSSMWDALSFRYDERRSSG